MAVRITRQLAAELANDRGGPERLVRDFAAWKDNWPLHEYDSPIFGKDGAYIEPTINGRRYLLRHVHLVPATERHKLRAWNAAYARRGRKISDRHLVYVENSAGDYLLVFILDEPGSHAIANMRTARDRETMEGFAALAEAFLHDGTVLDDQA